MLTPVVSSANQSDRVNEQIAHKISPSQTLLYPYKEEVSIYGEMTLNCTCIYIKHCSNTETSRLREVLLVKRSTTKQ